MDLLRGWFGDPLAVDWKALDYKDTDEFLEQKGVHAACTFFFYSDDLMRKFQDLATQLSDLLVDMLFHMGSLGPRLYAFLEDSCGVANKAYWY